MAPATGTQAVDRAASLVVAVLAAPEPVPFANLVVESGLPKSTLSRLLSSLERHGLIERTSDGAVQAGPRITDYALSVRPEDNLVRVSQPVLEQLGEETGETVNLAVPVGREVRMIAQVDSRYLLGAVNWLDRPVPFHCSALGRVLLAFGGTLPAGRLKSFTERTVTSRRDLQDELDRVRESGFSVVDSELEPGLVAIAAPILSTDGSAVAALSVSGPNVRLTPEAIPAVASALIRAAAAVADGLQPPAPSPSPIARKAGAA